MTTPKEALEAAMSRLEYLEIEYPTDESSGIEEIKAAIPVAELHQEAVDMLGEIVTYLREDGEIEFDSQIYNDAADILTKLEALKRTPSEMKLEGE